MPSYLYYGTYARFNTVSKKDAAALLGADNLVGDTFEIEFVTENGARTAWMKNRFGKLIGYFDPTVSRSLDLAHAQGLVLKALLSFIAYSEEPDPGMYWGEAALVCYHPENSKAFDRFVESVSARLMEGIRPDVDLGEQGYQQVVDSNGSWMPRKTIPLPEKKTGMAVLKSRRKLSEKLIEEGRKGNKGCYAVSWLFLIACAAGILFGLHTCGVF